MLGMSKEEFNKTCTATKCVTNLKIDHPRLWFEIWSDLNLVAIVGRRDPCMPGAPNDKGQIVKNKNAPRNARRLASLARSSASVSKPTNDSLGLSLGSRNDASSLPNQSPTPEENMSTSKIFLLQEHPATCFKQLGTEAIVSIVEDLILLNSELCGKLDKWKKPSARFKRDALVSRKTTSSLIHVKTWQSLWSSHQILLTKARRDQHCCRSALTSTMAQQTSRSSLQHAASLVLS
jgi:hypothetical protein